MFVVNVDNKHNVVFKYPSTTQKIRRTAFRSIIIELNTLNPSICHTNSDYAFLWLIGVTEPVDRWNMFIIW